MIGRILAVDYGGIRTGLAVSDPLGIIASPLAPIVSGDLQETVQSVVREVREREVRRVVVGMPYLPDGREGSAVQIVGIFIAALQPALPPGVELLTRDERHTTHEARALLRAGGYDRKRAKPLLDSVAAVVILREYLGEISRPPPPDPELDDE
ncbi:MAG: Holliday junction resolvase RuvX [Planctomycetota bacterium]|nr:Holliday junction resolvase RuvX [Planctomycetota bacterium]